MVDKYVGIQHIVEWHYGIRQASNGWLAYKRTHRDLVSAVVYEIRSLLRFQSYSEYLSRYESMAPKFS